MGGGSNKTTVTLPAWLEDAVKANLARANTVANIGSVPYYGPDVAAMTPLQLASIQGTSSAASEFGLPGGGMTGTEGMPMAQDYGGMSAYSSGDLYDQAVAELQARRPGQYNAITGMYINPYTGAPPTTSFAMPTQSMPTQGNSGSNHSANSGPYANTGVQNTIGGYTGLRDMLNGGGPGSAGTTFSNGPMSAMFNAAGISPIRR
jgi:hypothetical protein